MTYDPINNDTKNSRQPKKINKKNSIIHEKGQSQATIESSNHLNKPIKAQIILHKRKKTDHRSSNSGIYITKTN